MKTHQPITPIRINMMYDASADSAFKIGQTQQQIVSDTILKVIWSRVWCCVCDVVGYEAKAVAEKGLVEVQAAVFIVILIMD